RGARKVRVHGFGFVRAMVSAPPSRGARGSAGVAGALLNPQRNRVCLWRSVRAALADPDPVAMSESPPPPGATSPGWCGQLAKWVMRHNSLIAKELVSWSRATSPLRHRLGLT